MLRSLQELLGQTVTTWDGPLGTVQDLLFDKLDWHLRYVVAGEVEQQRLLIPAVINFPDTADGLEVDLSREQILSSPHLPQMPLTREFEAALHDHFGWELYTLELETDADDDEQTGANQHLRSLRAIAGHPLRANDGRAGTLVDFVANDENWALFYMVVRTGGLLEEEKDVLLPPSWIEQLDGGEILVDLTADTIRKSRPYDPRRLNDEDPA
jgi:hypothetical protein